MRPKPNSLRTSVMTDGVGQVERRHAELAGHVLFGLRETHTAGHLHAGNQISGSSHSAHPRGLRMRTVHAVRVAGAYL